MYKFYILFINSKQSMREYFYSTPKINVLGIIITLCMQEFDTEYKSLPRESKENSYAWYLD